MKPPAEGGESSRAPARSCNATSKTHWSVPIKPEAELAAQARRKSGTEWGGKDNAGVQRTYPLYGDDLARRQSVSSDRLRPDEQAALAVDSLHVPVSQVESWGTRLCMRVMCASVGCSPEDLASEQCGSALQPQQRRGGLRQATREALGARPPAAARSRRGNSGSLHPRVPPRADPWTRRLRSARSRAPPNPPVQGAPRPGSPRALRASGRWGRGPACGLADALPRNASVGASSITSTSFGHFTRGALPDGVAHRDSPRSATGGAGGSNVAPASKQRTVGGADHVRPWRPRPARSAQDGGFSSGLPCGAPASARARARSFVIGAPEVQARMA